MNIFSTQRKSKAFALIALVAVVLFSVGIPLDLNEETRALEIKTARAVGVESFIDFKLMFAYVGNAMLTVSGVAVYAGGLILDKATEITVAGLGKIAGGGDGGVAAIDIAWRALRDIGNIVIIFSLLAIGIATILRYSSYNMKAILVRLIVIALLINFSLLFTKLIIDVGNLLSFHFYQKISTSISCGEGESDFAECVSIAFSDKLKIATLYDVKQGFAVSDISDSGAGFVRNDEAVTALSSRQILVVGAMGSLFLIVTALVFFATAILLLIRLVILVFLMILSPLAFAGMILPYTQGYSKKWWDTLFSQTFFAPLMFLMFWVTLQIVGGLQEALNLSGSNFNDAFKGGGPSSAAVFANFVIVIGFMVGSLFIAKQLGAYGSSAIMKSANNLRKWGQGVAGGATFGLAARLGRETIGRGAHSIAESNTVKRWSRQKGLGGTLGRGLRATAGGVASSSFEARQFAGLGKELGIGSGKKGGYVKDFKARQEAAGKLARDISDTPEELQEAAEMLQQRTILTSILGTTAARRAMGGKLQKEADDEKAVKKLTEDRRELENEIDVERNLLADENVNASLKAQARATITANRAKIREINNELAGIRERRADRKTEKRDKARTPKEEKKDE